jgi:pimeloyl-ACP methyl ester carboxylesterase
MPTRRHFLAKVGTILAGGLLPGGLTARERPTEAPGSTVRLRDGRRLGFVEYGDPVGGKVLLYFHGVPTCRLEAAIYEPALRTMPGVRLLALDRPGVGLSDPAPTRGILDWPSDVSALLEARGIGRFAVIATSAGTPYGLATGRAMPCRVSRVVLVSPIAPPDSPAGREGSAAVQGPLARHFPHVYAVAVAYIAARIRRNPAFLARVIPNLSPPDRAFFDDPVLLRLAGDMTLESMRNGPAAVVQVIAGLTEPWAAWLPDVRLPVSIFYGTEDKVASPAAGPYLFKALPQVEATRYQGEGHFSVPLKFAAEILACASQGL